MEKRLFAVATLLSAVLLTVALSPLSGQQGSSYDSWLDYNGDGKVDASDLQALGLSYGGTGDSTKKVNVTNFPVDEHGNIRVKPRTVEKMVLMGTYLETEDGLMPIVIDENTPLIRNMRASYTNDSTFYLPASGITVYDRRFEYNATSLTGYEIRGQAIAQMWFELHIYSPSLTTVETNATLYLEKIGVDGDITVVCSDFASWSMYTGASQVSTFEYAFIFNFETPHLVNQNERLAMRLLVKGRSSSGQTYTAGYTHYLLTDFSFAIPIVIGLDT